MLDSLKGGEVVGLGKKGPGQSILELLLLRRSYWAERKNFLEVYMERLEM